LKLLKKDDPGETWVVLFLECRNRLGSWELRGFISGLQVVGVSGLLDSGLFTGVFWGGQLGVCCMGNLTDGSGLLTCFLVALRSNVTELSAVITLFGRCWRSGGVSGYCCRWGDFNIH
jgi:hypothetical protein